MEKEDQKFNRCDIVWMYCISEDYRKLHPEKTFEKQKVMILGSYRDLYDTKYKTSQEQYSYLTESGGGGSWVYPTFFEFIEKGTEQELQRRLRING